VDGLLGLCKPQVLSVHLSTVCGSPPETRTLRGTSALRGRSTAPALVPGSRLAVSCGLRDTFLPALSDLTMDPEPRSVVSSTTVCGPVR